MGISPITAALILCFLSLLWSAFLTIHAAVSVYFFSFFVFLLTLSSTFPLLKRVISNFVFKAMMSNNLGSVQLPDASLVNSGSHCGLIRS
jgi:hypothetical protein